MKKSRKTTRKYQRGGSIGTLVGAGVGSFVPGIGTAAGAGIGGAIGGLFDRQKEPEVLTPATYASGTLGYKKGGKLKKYRKGGKKKYPYGGVMGPGMEAQQVPLGQGAARYEGPPHEQGGIPVTQTGRPTDPDTAVAEVEGGETSQRMGDETFIFSDELIVPGTDLTFAQAHEILIEEGAPEEEIQELKQIQEQVRQQTEGGEMPPEEQMPVEDPEAMAEPPMGGMPAQPGATWGQEGMFRHGGAFRKKKFGGYPKTSKNKTSVGQNYRQQQTGEFKGNQKSQMVFQERQRLLQYRLGGSLRRMPTGGVLRDPGGRFVSPGATAAERLMHPNDPRRPQTPRTPAPRTTRGQRFMRGARTFGPRVGPGLAGTALATTATGAAGALYRARQRAQEWRETGFHPDEQSIFAGQRVHGAFADAAGMRTGFPEPILGDFERPTVEQEQELTEAISASPAPVTDRAGGPKGEKSAERKTIEPRTKEREGRPQGVNRVSEPERRKTRERRTTEPMKSAKRGGKPPRQQAGGPPQRGMERDRPDFLAPVNRPSGATTEAPNFGGGRQFNWGQAAGIAAFAAPAITNLAMARRAPRPESVGRMTHRPLPVTSPVFRQARGQMRAGYRTAMEGGAPTGLAHSQYLQGLSGMSAQEAQFRAEREAENEMMRRETEAGNIQLRARDLEATAQDRAQRMRLVTDAFEQPLSAYMQHRRNMQLAGAHISDERERGRFMDQSRGLFGFRRGGKLNRAFKRSNRINYPIRK